MSEEYSYYYNGQNQGNYSTIHNSHWNNWNGEHYYQRPPHMLSHPRPPPPLPPPPPPHPHSDKYIRNSYPQLPPSAAAPPPPHPPYIPNHVRSPGFNHQQMHSKFHRNRYSNFSNQYNGNAHHPWKRTQNNKRPQEFPEAEPQLKTTKKRKKPLSQNVPTKKEWSLEEAEEALNIEKEYNKKSKQALIIKFPDQELSKEIVLNLDSTIETVHFQQPCTPRFCFITLKDTADPDEVISTLNKQKFGQGLLNVEYKKDRDEDQIVHAEDIDPLTLYVGNLAQEITKEDMLKAYPTSKRIDIGFAKKMKYTRYAFVSFRSVPESIEAFKNTHNKDLHNKSLIVRFRRLHGTVGMPGEPKPQNPPKSRENNSLELETTIEDVNRLVNDSIASGSDDLAEDFSDLLPVEMVQNNVQTNYNNSIDEIELKYVKKERSNLSSDEEDVNYKSMPSTSTQFSSSFNDRKPIKTEMKIKTEVNDVYYRNSEATSSSVAIKQEPYSPSDDDHSTSNHENSEYTSNEIDDIFCGTTDFEGLYERMVNCKNKIKSLKKTGP